MPDPAQPNPLDTLPLPPIDVRDFLPAPLAERWRAGADPDVRRDVLASLSDLLNTLTTYLPRHLLLDLMTQPLPGRARGQFLSSSVLFADLSGFTAMSERLAALGREGAETLTGVVNDYFMAMSDIAAHHGGDLILFGGDAMLLLFDGVDHALRACHAAWRMQQAMAVRFAEMKTALGAFPLRMAVGLGSGPVFAAALGSAASMHYAVIGPALAAMARAEALAGAGHIVLDEATRRLAGSVRVEPESEPGYVRLIAEPAAAFTRPEPPRLEPPPDDEDRRIHWLAERIAAAAPFLPGGLLPRLLPDPTATLEGEHRPVSVLFVDFRDADALIDQLGADDPNAITPRLNAAFDAARAAVARYDGVINKVSVGPTGPHLIALFGAPRSHEDDPQRAVRAALEIQAALGGANLPGAHPPRIGVNTGFVYAANVGSRARREYTVMGDQVNLAARLMAAAAPGEVVVSASTAARVQDVFDLDERPAVMLKGKSQPQRNFRLRGARARPAAMTHPVAGPVWGREDELAACAERIERAAQGHGQIVAVSGEAGIGKSRVIEALALRARAVGFEHIGGACVSYGGDIPYSAWLELLREVIGVQPGDAEADRRRRLQAALAAIDRGDDGPIVGEIAGVSMPDTAWTASLDAQARQRRLFDAVAGLIRRRARQRPLLLTIDDAHWIDPASRDLLDYLARRMGDAALVLLAAYRPEGRWTGWYGLPNAVEINLPPLARDAIEAFIADLLAMPERRLPLAVRALLERMSAGALSAAPDAAAFERYWGNPFFTEERIRALIDSGVLVREADGQPAPEGGSLGWQVTRPIESIEMPDTIHGVILSRIDRLPEPARRVLQVASVIGRVIDLDLLHTVHDVLGESPDLLRRHLADLADLGLSPLDANETRYVFRSVTMQEVTYDSLRYERRRELHRRIGEQVEARATLADDVSGLLAHHFFQGQVWDKALAYALEAGWRAQQRYANAAAAGAYRRALQAAGQLSPPRALEQLAAHEALGDVLSITGEYDGALAHYEQARALAGDNSRQVADLCRKTAEAHEKRSAYDEAFHWLERGLQVAAPDSLEAAWIYLMGAGVFHRQGKLDAAVEWGETSLRIARALSDDAARRAEARGLYLLAELWRKRGDLDRAIDSAQRAVSVYLLAGDVAGQSQALNTLANIHSDQGDLVSATRFYTDSLQLKERIGDVGGQAILTVNLGEAFRVLGELAEARRMFERSLQLCRDLGNAYAVALLHNNLAAVAVAEGGWDEAEKLLAESEKSFRDMGSEDFKAELLRHRAELSLGRGLLDEALAQARQAVAAAEDGQEKLEIGLSRRVLGQACVARGDLAGAEQELQASLEVLESIGSRLEAASTRVALARLRRLQDRAGEARALLDAAVAAYEAAGAGSLKARALLE
jgi:predicted ATPase/class 3 adenylate cyclase